MHYRKLMNKSINIKFIIVLVLILLTSLAYGFSFAFETPKEEEMPVYLQVSDVTLGLTDSVDSIYLDKIMPTLDKFGLMNKAFNFSVTNSDDLVKNFVIRLIDTTTTSTLANSNIRYELTRNNMVYDIRNLSGSGVIDAGTIEPNNTYNYSCRVWLDHESEATSGIWSKVVSVISGGVNIDVSGANPPLLTNNLIPVYYDETTDAWKKADENNININYKWYDYDNQEWANAVTVSETNRQEYIDSSVGTIVKMEDINSMWVWIPRYKYVLFDSSEEQSIKIIFERGVRNTSTVSCKNTFGKGKTTEICSDKTNGSLINGVSTYLHPAFKFGSEELTGIWVSKFEAGINEDSSCYKTNGTSNCNNSNSIIYIKPNMKAINYITMANLAYSFRKMELANNIYGFTSLGTFVNNDLSIKDDTNDIDIHMIKNSEWSSISYLSQSIYGIKGNLDFLDDNIYMNNNHKGLTGCSSGTTSDYYEDICKYAYNINKHGTGASTTGNIYGVYDMNGGRNEYVMTNYQETNEFVINNYNDFKASNIKTEYYDSYRKTDSNSFNDIFKLGDAIKETSSWSYSDILTNYNSLVRGYNGENSNIFSYKHNNIATSESNSSRPVLKVKQYIYITEW